MDHTHHLEKLDTLLNEYAWLWRPQPYKESRPAWCAQLPALTARLLALSDAELARLYRSDASLYDLLADYLPPLHELHRLTALPRLPAVTLKELGPHFNSDIPGRKWEQINAFTAAVNSSGNEVLEWCGGKGHLGRLIAAQWRLPVQTLELDAELCHEGEHLAKRAHVEQRFHHGDAFAPQSRSLLHGRHPLALHACGGLHRTLIQNSVQEQVPALDIAPCCYHLFGADHYQPFTPNLRLQPSREDLRIAVTETVTAKQRQVRQRDREMAWKLGYQLLRQAISGSGEYAPTKPIDKQWLNLTFAGFCHELARRQGLELPEGIDWQAYEERGWQRQREVMRLSLIRQAFRRPLELWLVLDLVSHLEHSGYRVQLGTFCEAEVTPRNILISARR